MPHVSPMRTLETKIPPAALAIFFALVMWPLSIIAPPVNLGEPTRLLASALVLLLGAFFCIAGIISFNSAKTTVNPLNPEAASSPVSSGIYKISRNPMYVGFSLFLVAWSVYLSSPLALIGVLGFVLYINRFQIVPEEGALTAIFGAEFVSYQSTVRLWL